ncbi:hypothetical protein [Saccharolobus shibatae]|uniref:Conjugation-related protein n=1 Tax=Saccharolobus shibatae TaxID=2286 RepID=A0A8F5BSC8_9CREN|nr:hypothetical protein [Saccharolobus shibatae]QXJ30343.1 Conjugation-related protein [Saccharolobus shibatae]QXJ30445.1 Conjugation-related protein [Saccharolobus shibatae]
MKARRLQFGYLKTINSLDEKSFPLLIRTVSMRELIVIFPSIIIGLILFLKHEIIYAAIPLMLAFYVLLYNEKSVPFYYQFMAFIEDLLSPPKIEKKPKKVKRKLDFKKYEKELEYVVLSSTVFATSIYFIDFILYSSRPNFIVLLILAIVAGLSLSLLLIKVLDLVSKR